jgi:hypothetical protein
MKNKIGGIITIISITIAIILFCLLSIIGLHIEDNTGSQVGYITTIDTNGLIIKTTSVYIKSNLESSQEERYCVEGDDVITNLKFEWATSYDELKAKAVKRYKYFEKKFISTHNEYWLGRMDEIEEFNNLTEEDLK